MFLILLFGSNLILYTLYSYRGPKNTINMYDVILGELTIRFVGPEVMKLGADYTYNGSTYTRRVQRLYNCTRLVLSEFHRTAHHYKIPVRTQTDAKTRFENQTTTTTTRKRNDRQTEL